MAVKLVKPKKYKQIPNILDSDFEDILLNLGVKDEFYIAASGGPDSLCLILLANLFAKKNKIKMSVLTVDHQLRKESSQEAIWLNKLLKKMKIKHHILKWSGKKPSSNIMEAARLKRYELMTNRCIKQNVKFLLTTHFIRLCNLLEKHKNIINKSMKTTVVNNDPNYTYKITNGISTIKGGVCVLKQLNYPQEIIDTTNKILDKL